MIPLARPSAGFSFEITGLGEDRRRFARGKVRLLEEVPHRWKRFFLRHSGMPDQKKMGAINR